ncbi:hypothetical protein [Kaarinaea lacus]
MHTQIQMTDRRRLKNARIRVFYVTVILLFLLFPIQQAAATSAIANAVLAACAPNPTVPDVNSCSACHSTTNNRGPNDLTTAGQWSLSTSTYMNFCPTTTPPPTPTPTPTPPPSPTPPPPTSGMGMSSQPPTPGIGMGRGGDDDDDDDDDDYEDDDDDGGSASSLRSRSSGSRRFSRRSRD